MGFLTSVRTQCPLHHWKRHQSWKGIASVVLDGVTSSSHQYFVAWLYYHFAHGVCDFPFKNCFHLCGWYVHCLLNNSLYLFYVQAQENHPIDEHLRTLPDVDLLDVDLILPYCPLYFTNTRVLPTDDANCRVTIWSSSPKGVRSWPSEPSTINLQRMVRRTRY